MSCGDSHALITTDAGVLFSFGDGRFGTSAVSQKKKQDNNPRAKSIQDFSKFFRRLWRFAEILPKSFPFNTSRLRLPSAQQENAPDLEANSLFTLCFHEHITLLILRLSLRPLANALPPSSSHHTSISSHAPAEVSPPHCHRLQKPPHSSELQSKSVLEAVVHIVSWKVRHHRSTSVVWALCILPRAYEKACSLYHSLCFSVVLTLPSMRLLRGSRAAQLLRERKRDRTGESGIRPTNSPTKVITKMLTKLSTKMRSHSSHALGEVRRPYRAFFSFQTMPG